MLIKFMVSSIPMYGMSSFLIPQTLCTQIDSQLRHFWCGYQQDKRHNLSLLSRHKICSLKSIGGIGLRLTKDTNLALLSKMA